MSSIHQQRSSLMLIICCCFCLLPLLAHAKAAEKDCVVTNGRNGACISQNHFVKGDIDVGDLRPIHDRAEKQQRPCVDSNPEDCPGWAQRGECDANPAYMRDNCQFSCNVCRACHDDHDKCRIWASQGECASNPDFMLRTCQLSCYVCSDVQYTPEELVQGKDLGQPQTMTGDGSVRSMRQVKRRVEESRAYMTTTVRETMEYGMDAICKNKHADCSYWAVSGECETNEKFMKEECGPACLSCEVHTLAYRCPIDPKAPVAWQPGDLNAMFERLTSEPYLSQHSVEVLSSPQLNGGPWVITMEDVVSQAEAERLIELGADEGYERSADAGAINADGTFDEYVYEGRTSTTAWCDDDCYDDPLASAVLERLSNFTQIDDMNSEHLQLLRYGVGQFYNVHHDYLFASRNRQDGPRILTMYLYLNDVEAGGGTNFDKLGITVMPKRGRALLWPSVLNDSPLERDDRTTHQALPVEKGVKFGANAWFHLRDYKTASENDCT